MDTAVLKSWFEVVRRTDPLIWTLAMDSPSSSQAENSIDSLILSSSSPCPPSSPSLFASTSAPTALTGSGSDTAAMDIIAVKTRMFSSLQNSHCKSLAVSQPQNATDCLKCLVQTTTSHDELHLKQDSHQHRLPQTMRRSVERGAAKAPAGSLVVAMAMENVHKDNEAMISRRTTGASSEQENAPAGSTSNTGTASGSTGSGPGSPSSSSSKASGSSTNAHQRKTTNNNHNNHSDNTYYATTFNWMYYATEPVAASAAASPSTRFGSRIEDHAGTSSSTTSSSGNAVGGGGAIISTSMATAAAAAVASHIAREREALAAASAAAAALSSGELQVSESTNNSDTLANTNNSIDSTIANNAIASATTTATTTTTTATTTTTTTTTPSVDNNKNTQSLPARLTTLLPQASTITVASTTQFLHSILLSSTEATTAFLYRTFSPTYRICTLYKTSFTDGSQRRGLTRMKDSVMRADAVVLVKSSAKQMKDVWGMVMDAYGVKAKMTKEKKRQEEREKAVRETREIVEERIRSKKIGEAIVAATETAPTTTEVEVEVEVERRKSVGDDGDGGSSSEGGTEGMGEE